MRNGDYIQTYTGRKFYPCDPRPEEIDILDIAHSLSNQCRFSGHCLSFYSVAQHSVLVSDNLSSVDRLWGLLHDASESYLVDLPRPLKRSPPLGPIYTNLENRLMSAIAERFSLPGEIPSAVKHMDNRLLMTERRDLMALTEDEWIETADPLPERIIPWVPGDAEALFLQAFYSI